MEWMVLPLKRYFEFSGRSRRREFWMYVLFTIIVSVVLSLLDTAFGLGGRVTGIGTQAPGAYGYGGNVRGGVLANVFALATFIPNLSVAVRRLHDTDRSGWWILLPAVPLVIGIVVLVTSIFTASTSLGLIGGAALLATLVCGIVLLVWYCSDGTRGPNRFGDDPKSDIPADLARTFE